MRDTMLMFLLLPIYSDNGTFKSVPSLFTSDQRILNWEETILMHRNLILIIVGKWKWPVDNWGDRTDPSGCPNIRTNKNLHLEGYPTLLF